MSQLQSTKAIVRKGAEYITKVIHVELLRWKMEHGKKRPMLMKYAMDLTDEQVINTSREAFALYLLSIRCVLAFLLNISGVALVHADHA